MTHQLSSGRDRGWPWAAILLLGTFDSTARRQPLPAPNGPRPPRFRPPLSGVDDAAPRDLDAGGVVGAARGRRELCSRSSRTRCGGTISGLDEMSRLLQFEAMSVTYLVGFAVFITAHFFAGASGWSWQVPALAYLGLELVRGLVLAVLARKFA